jgi:hypothetical protein
MEKSFNRLLFILLILIIPIPVVICDFNSIDLPGGIVRLLVQLFGVFFSGPLLLLYSLMVHEFVTVEKKKVLFGIAFLTGFCWLTYLFYLHMTRPPD